jgi:TPR repeat protein
LAWCFNNGEGVEKDPKQATFWQLKANQKSNKLIII